MTKTFDPVKAAFPMTALGNVSVGKAQYVAGESFDAMSQQAEDFLLSHGKAKRFTQEATPDQGTLDVGKTEGDDVAGVVEMKQETQDADPAKGTPHDTRKPNTRPARTRRRPN